MITVTAQDALKTAQLTPGVKPGRCVRYIAGTDKNGATLHRWIVEVREEGYPEWVPLKDYTVSEKAISMGKGFYIACGFPEDIWEDLMKGKLKSYQFSETDCVGKEFDVNVINTMYNGKIQNEAQDFMKKQPIMG